MLTQAARALIERHAPALLAMTPRQIAADIKDGGPLRDALTLHEAAGYRAFYAPFDWINPDADIVLVGVTPGRHQAQRALVELKQALAAGKTVEEAAEQAKTAASFDGQMRTNSVRLMDHFGLHELFGIGSTAELYDGPTVARVHYTSAVRYPVLIGKSVDGRTEWKDYSGDARILSRPVTKMIIDDHLEEEMSLFQDAWIVPFGGTAGLVVDEMVRRGVLREEKVLQGVLHPAGGQQNRFNCQLDLVEDHAHCAKNVGCDALQERTRALFDKVASLRAAAAPGL